MFGVRIVLSGSLAHKQDNYQYEGYAFMRIRFLFSLINVFLKMKAKRRMEMAKTQKNEGFLARLVKITNTFVQKPLIFALKFANA